jgi:hypothetical protein
MPLPAMLGAIGLNPLILGQTVPRDDVSSAASVWSKCGKKLVAERWSLRDWVVCETGRGEKCNRLAFGTGCLSFVSLWR